MVPGGLVPGGLVLCTEVRCGGCGGFCIAVPCGWWVRRLLDRSVLRLVLVCFASNYQNIKHNVECAVQCCELQCGAVGAVQW